ncbi:5'-3' exonuclease H3TH domain-containing protein [Verrucomicrobiota bacterium]
MSCDRLILIDGMCALYRAFYAIKNLSTKSGRPTNAVFGFVRMLNQIRELRNPSHWAVVFDGGLPKDRVEMLEEYKAQRPSMPDALREQISVVEDYLDKAEIAWVRKDGEEADDVIASIADWAESQSDSIMIATNDKDIYQLINRKTNVIPVAGRNDPFGPESVKSKTGVAPSQMIDWLALVGDSADNIPGVPGVGPKTAAKLINAFGSVQEIWKHLDKVESKKLRRSLQDSRDLVSRNMKIVRLKRDLGSLLNWDELKVRSVDPGKVLPLLEELELHSLARELREGDLFKK